jgi:HTH-type transcriptional regulator/antitoxin HigA
MATLQPVVGTSGLDVGRYSRLIAKLGPKKIETEAENDAALAIVEKLMMKGDALSPEEAAALDLLTSLIEQFEETAYPIPDAEPRQVLRFLMESNDLKAIDLADTLGSRSKVSEILAGTRSISKGQAKRLGERFRISPAAFI